MSKKLQIKTSFILFIFIILLVNISKGEAALNSSNNTKSLNLSKIVSPTGYIYINESEFYKKGRSYITGMPSGNFCSRAA